jgi:hypothetical protein
LKRKEGKEVKERIVWIAIAILMVSMLLFCGCGVPQAEVDKLVADAHNEGYNEGEEVGYEDGYQVGYENGHEAGFKDGYRACQAEQSGGADLSVLDQYGNSALVYKPIELSYSIAGCDHYLIYLRGDIISISGRTITIAAGDDTLSIEVSDDVSVPVLEYAPGETLVYGNDTFQDAREIGFESLRVGDSVFIVLNLSMCTPDSPKIVSIQRV